MTLSAVLRALDVSRPRSYIFIFTEGPAKDYQLLPKVLKRIQQKQSQVVFILKGQCDRPDHVGYHVYDEIAMYSSGQVLYVDKTEIGFALKFVEASVQMDKVHLLSINSPKRGSHSYTFLVDSQLKNILVSAVSKRYISVKIRNPKGKKPGADKLKQIIKLPNLVVSKIEKPQVGVWNITIKSTGNYSLQVTSESRVYINYGFKTTKEKVKTGSKLDRQPLMGMNLIKFFYIVVSL